MAKHLALSNEVYPTKEYFAMCDFANGLSSALVRKLDFKIVR